jgi:subtilisin family serine protease
MQLHRKPFAARAGSALLGSLVALFTCAGAHAADAGKQRFTPVKMGAITNPYTTARSLDTKPAYVIVVLAGESVADVQLRESRKLSRAEKDTVKSQRAAEQLKTRPSIEALGGRVVGNYQSALNGVKVRIPNNRVAALRGIPGVVSVQRVNTYKPENFLGVQRVQAPFAWSGARGVRGENIKIAVIDTGIDYTHADFGGPGTVEAFDTAFADSAGTPNSAYFGPTAPKVKGGIDLAGNAYDADGVGAAAPPVPDPNPLDCNGHGSHVAGTAAGFGVKLDGTTYNGPYDQTTHSNAFTVGPGAAPRADLYAVKVFGCEGSTSLVPEALDWAVDNDMDVVNMSLGSNFGGTQDASAVATDNAVKAGIVVVMSAGNAGAIEYVTGSPGSATRGIATAATPSVETYRTANLDTTPTVNAINANGANYTSPLALNTKVLRNPDNSVSLGCDPAEYTNAGVAGKLVIVTRGVCARVARAVFGQQAGAAAVLMINNAAVLPPFEGPITGNPDTGEQYNVTIPFFGVSSTSAAAVVAKDGQTTTLTEGTPLPTGTASFSSMGPRTGDSFLKPDISAPGEAIISAGVGTGNGPATLGGTSMASPHVAGVAALTRQAHANWAPGLIKAAIINSGDPGAIAGYLPRRNGSGMVDASASTGTSAIAYGDNLRTSVSFGLQEFKSAVSKTKPITVQNKGRGPITFNASIAKLGSPHTAILNTTQVTVPAGGSKQVKLTLTVPGATAGNSDEFRDVSGVVTFTPTGNGNNGIALSVPYLLVPRVSSNVNAAALPKFTGSPKASRARLTNVGSLIPATADFYAWGLNSPNAGLGLADLRAAGVQSFGNPANPVVVFAVNTFKKWSSGFNVEFDIYLDSNGDGVDDYVIFNVDQGLLTTGTRNGVHLAVIANLTTGALSANYTVWAPTDSSTMLLPVNASSIGLSAGNPRLSYAVFSFDLTSDAEDAFVGSARYNAFAPAITTGDFVTVAPNATVDVPLTVNSTEWAITPARGVMIVSQDNKSGQPEAKLLGANF